LTIAKGNQAKINYSGRCAPWFNMNLSVAGTIAFDDSAQHYQAVMYVSACKEGPPWDRFELVRHGRAGRGCGAVPDERAQWV